MRSLPDQAIPVDGTYSVTARGNITIQALSGVVYVSNTGGDVGKGFRLNVGEYYTFATDPDGLQVTNSSPFPVTIAIIQN